MAELVDATDSKSVSREAVRVRVSLGAHCVVAYYVLWHNCVGACMCVVAYCVSSGRSAAWLARPSGGREVGGSNPLAPTMRGFMRRGAGVVERGGLENRCAFMGTEGSNPSLSAKSTLQAFMSHCLSHDLGEAAVDCVLK